MLARGGRALDQCEMAVGRGQEQKRLDRGVGEHLVERGRERIGVACGERLPPRLARRVAARDLDPCRELLQALEVGLERHAQAYDREPPPLPHFTAHRYFLNSAGRFSRKARMPSRWSPAAKHKVFISFS